MTEIGRPEGARNPQTAFGRALRIAWWSYVRRLDADLAAAGFDERRFPMIYMFALYAEPAAMTISQMAGRFAISRQAASKIVAKLRELGYVTVTPSTTDRREKMVELTSRAVEYLTARRRAASALDTEIQSALGGNDFDHLQRVLAAVAEIANRPGMFDSGFRTSNFGGLFGGE